MEQIPKDQVRDRIQKLSVEQARVALQEVRGGESLDKAVAIAQSYPPKELHRMIELVCGEVREAV